MTGPFETADAATKTFYSKLFFNVLLNINAVNLGMFDTYLCETDDPRVVQRWRDDFPRMVGQVSRHIRQMRGEE